MENETKVSEINPEFTGIVLEASSAKSDEIEQKIWKVVQDVPGLNVGYGTFRLIVYISKGNKEQAWRSAIGIAKGLLQSAAIVGSVFVAPVLAPIAAGAFTGIATESIQGAAHVIIFVIEHSGELLKSPAESKEKLMYNEVKEVSAVGALYSTVRAPTYALKGDKDEATASGINAATGTIDTAIGVGLSMVPLNNELKNAMHKTAKSLLQLLSRKDTKLCNDEAISNGKSVDCDSLKIITLQREKSNDDAEIGDLVVCAEIKDNIRVPAEEKERTVDDGFKKTESRLDKISRIIRRQNRKEQNAPETIVADQTEASSLLLPNEILSADKINNEETCDSIVKSSKNEKEGEKNTNPKNSLIDKLINILKRQKNENDFGTLQTSTTTVGEVTTGQLQQQVEGDNSESLQQELVEQEGIIIVMELENNLNNEESIVQKIISETLPEVVEQTFDSNNANLTTNIDENSEISNSKNSETSNLVEQKTPKSSIMNSIKKISYILRRQRNIEVIVSPNGTVSDSETNCKSAEEGESSIELEEMQPGSILVIVELDNSDEKSIPTEDSSSNNDVTEDQDMEKLKVTIRNIAKFFTRQNKAKNNTAS